MRLCGGHDGLQGGSSAELGRSAAVSRECLGLSDVRLGPMLLKLLFWVGIFRDIAVPVERLASLGSMTRLGSFNHRLELVVVDTKRNACEQIFYLLEYHTIDPRI